MMEDSLRNFMQRTIGDYYHTIARFCPESVKVITNDTVEIVGGCRFPLFTVDLKFINASSPTSPAQFIYSAAPEASFDAIVLRLKPYSMQF